MPAAAVASFTPAISGMSGTLVGARGETAVDIKGISGFEAREALCITFVVRTGEALPVAAAYQPGTVDDNHSYRRAVDDGTSTGCSDGMSRARSRCAGIAR